MLIVIVIVISDSNERVNNLHSCTLGQIDKPDMKKHKIKLIEIKNLFNAQPSDAV